MNPITVTVTGRLGDDPRTFTTRDGTTGVELRLALDLPSRIPGGDGITRWVKVTAYGLRTPLPDPRLELLASLSPPPSLPARTPPPPSP